MKVKCKICGDKIERDNAFKIVKEQKSKNINFYYCNEEEYNKQQDEVNQRNKCYETIAEMLDVKFLTPGMIKQINTIKEYYEYPIISKAFKHKESDILWAINNKNFNGEYNKFRYVMAIVLDNIEQVKKVHMKELEEMNRLFNKVEHSEVNVDIMNEIEVVKPINTKRSNDISHFLD